MEGVPSNAAPAPSITRMPVGNADGNTAGTKALTLLQENSGDAGMSGFFETAPCEEKSAEEDRPSPSCGAGLIVDAQGGREDDDDPTGRSNSHDGDTTSTEVTASSQEDGGDASFSKMAAREKKSAEEGGRSPLRGAGPIVDKEKEREDGDDPMGRNDSLDDEAVTPSSTSGVGGDVMEEPTSGVGEDVTEEPRNSDDPSSKFCWRECPDDVLDGDPLFDSLDTAVKCWSVLPYHVRSAVPTGRRLVVPLSVFENECLQPCCHCHCGWG